MKWPWVRRATYDALYRDYWEIREDRDRLLIREPDLGLAIAAKLQGVKQAAVEDYLRRYGYVDYQELAAAYMEGGVWAASRLLSGSMDNEWAGELRSALRIMEAANKEANDLLIHGDGTAPEPQGVINARK